MLKWLREGQKPSWALDPDVTEEVNLNFIEQNWELDLARQGSDGKDFPIFFAGNVSMGAPAWHVFIEGKVSWKYQADIMNGPSQSYHLVKSQGLGKLTP